MKTRLFLVLGLCASFATAAIAQDPGPAAAVPTRSPEQLDELLGPIALYPDALVALMLPAATVSSDIVLAQRYVAGGGDVALVDEQSWDESVKSLTHYPDVLRWMDENLEWTKQVGEAFAVQPADVMQSIQRLRARARAVGTLKDTPQQSVVVEDQDIRIIPADPEVIYVPYYDPEIVYVEPSFYYPDPFITFSVGFRVGWWLSYDCDWHHRNIWVSNRRHDWVGYREWRHPVFPGDPHYVSRPDRRPWTPPPGARWAEHHRSYSPHDRIVRPTPHRDPRYHGSSADANRDQRRPQPVRPPERPQQNNNNDNNSNSNRIVTTSPGRQIWRPTNNTANNSNSRVTTSAPGSSFDGTGPVNPTRTTERRNEQNRGRYDRGSNRGAPPQPVSPPVVTTTSQPRPTVAPAAPQSPPAIVRSPESGRSYNRGTRAAQPSPRFNPPAPTVQAPRAPAPTVQRSAAPPPTPAAAPHVPARFQVRSPAVGATYTQPRPQPQPVAPPPAPPSVSAPQQPQQQQSAASAPAPVRPHNPGGRSGGRQRDNN